MMSKKKAANARYLAAMAELDDICRREEAAGVDYETPQWQQAHRRVVAAERGASWRLTGRPGFLWAEVRSFVRYRVLRAATTEWGTERKRGHPWRR